MKITDLIKETFKDNIKGTVFTRKEIIKKVIEKYNNVNEGSIIPSDYCYNRTNKGIEFSKKPRLFYFLGDGMYECLGENYPFNGPVYTCEKGSAKEIEVGVWENGIFYENENWNLYCLK